MGQETPRFSCKEGQVLCMKPAARYPVRALLSWCNLSLPALDEITSPPPCPSPSLHNTGVAKYIRVHLRPLNTPLNLGHVVIPLYKLPFQSQLLVLFSW